MQQIIGHQIFVASHAMNSLNCCCNINSEYVDSKRKNIFIQFNLQNLLNTQNKRVTAKCVCAPSFIKLGNSVVTVNREKT